MEDQGKRLLLAVGIIAVLFIAWNFLFPPPKPAPRRAETPVTAPTPAPATAPAAGPTAPAAPGTPAEAVPAVACQLETDGAPRWDTADYTATFSRCGGTIASLVLKGKQYREKVGENEVQMNLVRPGGDAAYFPFQAQVLASAPGVSNPDEHRNPIIPDRATWELASATADQVVYRWTSPDHGLLVEKTFKKLAARYGMQLDVEVRNISEKAGEKRIAEASLTTFGHQDPNAAPPSMLHYAEPTWGTACYVDGELKSEQLKDLRSETHARTGDVRWVGILHQYFLLAMAPLDHEQPTCSRSSVTSVAGVLRADLLWGVPATLEPKQSFKHAVVVYAGPKLVDQLDAVSKLSGQETKLSEAVNFGWLAVLCKPMLFLLKTFHGWVGNWGVAIILLTVVVKLLTLYWTQKSMRSMKAMSKLKPEMDKIKEKFPDDKQRQNVEMMNLYKAHKISPLGGCLPLLLQMPIWFALYRTLSTAADLYRAPFVGWIHNLTAPDPYYIVPVVLTGLMFLQARISPASVDSQQQKIMQWMMPIMMGFFSLLFPAGLGVYMITNTVLGMAHQYYMNKTDPGKPAAVAVVETPAPAPSAPPRSGERPPRGPKRKNVAKARG